MSGGADKKEQLNESEAVFFWGVLLNRNIDQSLIRVGAIVQWQLIQKGPMGRPSMLSSCVGPGRSPWRHARGGLIASPGLFHKQQQVKD